MKEHEALGKLDEVFEQLDPASRERALTWLRAKYPEQKASQTIVGPPHPQTWWTTTDRTTCGGGVPVGHGGAFTTQTFETHGCSAS